MTPSTLSRLRDLLIRYVLGQSIAAKQKETALPDFDFRDFRKRFLGADRTREYIRKRRPGDAFLGQHPFIGQLLGDGLIACESNELPLLILIAAAVAYLHDVRPWPYRERQRQRRCHRPPLVTRRPLGAHRGMRFVSRGPERVRQRNALGIVFSAAEFLVAPQRVRHIVRDRFDGHPASVGARYPAADAVRDEHQGGESLTPSGELRGIGETRAVNDNLRMNRRQQKVILISGAHIPAMRQPEQVNFVVAWPDREVGGDRRLPSFGTGHDELLVSRWSATMLATAPKASMPAIIASIQ